MLMDVVIHVVITHPEIVYISPWPVIEPISYIRSEQIHWTRIPREITKCRKSTSEHWKICQGICVKGRKLSTETSRQRGFLGHCF